MKISELIGSQVLSLSGAKICGVICGARFSKDLSRMKAAEVFVSDDDDCERKFIEVRKIRSAAHGAVAVMNESVLLPDCPEYARSPVNLPAYSETGEPLGRITDVTLDESYKVLSLCTPERSYPLSDVLSRSDELIVFRLPGSKTRVKRSVPRVPRPAPSPSTDGGVKAQAAPGRYGFLLGRRTSSDVSDTSGNRIADAGERITDDVITLARERGAIVRLTMSCMEHVSP